MQPFTLVDLAEATGGRLLRGNGSTVIHGVSTDSRTIQTGELFVPLLGEHFDGHLFLGAAADGGAAAVLVEEARIGEVTLPAEVGVVAVQSSLGALQRLAAWHRSAFKGPVIAITGSNGKTTTKDLTASVLRQRYRTLATEGNLNSEIGVALTLLRRDAGHEVLVVEMGMRGAGQIAELVQIAKPNIGVVTNVGPVHTELLLSIDGVAAAKAELPAGLPPDGFAILNVDDPKVWSMAELTYAAVVGFGLGEEARVRGLAPRFMGLEGSRFDLAYEGERVPVDLRLPGPHNVANALAAAAVGIVCGLTLEQIAHGLAEVRPSGMRMEVLRLPHDITVINDAYNASPASMMAAIGILASATATRRIAVLGDMLELGPLARLEHRRIGRLCADSGLDFLITVGEQARQIAEAATEAGMAAHSVSVADEPEQAAHIVQSILQPGDVVLVKASRGLRLERVVDMIRALVEERE